MDDALGFPQIQRGVVESGRQENAVQRFQGYAFGALVDKLLTQLAKKDLLFRRERLAEKDGRVFHDLPSFQNARIAT